MNLRSLLYTSARALGDLHAIKKGKVPQRVIRRVVYRHSSRVANWVCRKLGVSR